MKANSCQEVNKLLKASQSYKSHGCHVHVQCEYDTRKVHLLFNVFLVIDVGGPKSLYMHASYSIATWVMKSIGQSLQLCGT